MGLKLFHFERKGGVYVSHLAKAGGFQDMSVSFRVSFDSKAHEEKLLESLIDTFKKKCMREVSGSVRDGRFF